MRYIALIISIYLLSLGCHTYPRYKTGPPITPEDKTVDSTLISTNEFIRFGRILNKYLGHPYKGTSAVSDGMDCSMFTFQVFRDFNRSYLPLSATEQYKQGIEVPRTRLRFGDLVFFKTDRTGRISHVGIYLGTNDFIHSSSSYGVIISNLSDKYWARCYFGARRILK